MVKEQLIINGVDVPLQGSLNPNLTYSIQDIKEPEKRKSTFSKTVTLPGSKILNDLFNFIFEINIEGTFNPNLKADITYLVDSQTILTGFIKLNAIRYLDNSDIEYDCTLLGETANFFTDLGDLELTDIQNLDDFNHPYTDTVQFNSWATQIYDGGGYQPFSYGYGYTYPLIDYGADPSLEEWGTLDMYPAFYVKELFDRIFSDAGYTYTSTTLSASNKAFNRAIIPFNGDKFGLSAAQIANRTFEADTPTFLSSMSSISFQSSSNVSFTDVSDPGGIHNLGVFTAPGTGRYNLSTSIDFRARFTPDPTAGEALYPNTKLKILVQFWLNTNVQILGSAQMYISPDYTNTVAAAGSYTTSGSPTYPSDEYNKSVTTTTGACNNPITLLNRSYDAPNTLVLNLQNVPLQASDTVTVKVIATQEKVNTGCGNLWYNAALTNTYTGTVALSIVNTGYFKGLQVNSEYAIGDTVDMYGAVPRKIKQRDFILSIFNMFNIYVEPDVDNPKNLILQTRDTFYEGTTKDWSQKLDVSQDLIFEPMGALDASRYIFTYKEDKDYYNQKYIDSYDDIYGQREIIVNNEFLKNTYTNKVIFSPTPSVGQASNDRVIPSIIKVDNQQQAQRTESNIRYLIYDGLKSTQSTWIHEGTVRTTYPYCGHFDDAFNPTVDVNFGLPAEIYWDNTFYAITITDNNLYNKYHRKGLEEITDKDSKIVKGWFYLTPLDISQMSFKYQYYFNGAYHRLLKVNNYNPSEVSLTECWFLKLKTKATYSTITNPIGGGVDEPYDVSTDEFFPVLSQLNVKQSDSNTYDAKNGTIQGEDNIVDPTAKNFSISGDGNVISADTKNIQINGDNNTIYPGLENVTLINTSDITVEESNVTYIDGQQTKGEGSILLITDTTPINMRYLGYEVDSSSTAITMSLPEPFDYEGMEFSIKVIDNTNLISISGTSNSTTLDGEELTYLTSVNDLISIYSNGNEWRIK